jgi:hypothetical protein
MSCYLPPGGAGPQVTGANECLADVLSDASCILRRSDCQCISRAFGLRVKNDVYSSLFGFVSAMLLRIRPFDQPCAIILLN